MGEIEDLFLMLLLFSPGLGFITCCTCPSLFFYLVGAWMPFFFYILHESNFLEKCLPESQKRPRKEWISWKMPFSAFERTGGNRPAEGCYIISNHTILSSRCTKSESQRTVYTAHSSAPLTAVMTADMALRRLMRMMDAWIEPRLPQDPSSYQSTTLKYTTLGVFI